MSPFLLTGRRNSPRNTLAIMDTRRNDAIGRSAAKQNGSIVCNHRRCTDSAVRPNLPEPIGIESFQRESLRGRVVMRSQEVNGPAWANCWWKKYGTVFGDRTGPESLRDPAAWAINVPRIRPINAGSAVISDIVIGAIEVPQTCENSVCKKHNATREAYLPSKARPPSRRETNTIVQLRLAEESPVSPQNLDGKAKKETIPATLSKMLKRKPVRLWLVRNSATVATPKHVSSTSRMRNQTIAIAITKKDSFFEVESRSSELAHDM